MCVEVDADALDGDVIAFEHEQEERDRDCFLNFVWRRKTSFFFFQAPSILEQRSQDSGSRSVK